MFFEISKLAWVVLDLWIPLFLLLAAGALLLFSPWRSMGRGVIALVVIGWGVIAVIPFGQWMTVALEERFAAPRLPETIDGIVILGGVIDPYLSHRRGQPAVGGNIERILSGAALAKRHPGAKVVFTGGSGDLFLQEFKEGPYAGALLADLGIARDRLIVEEQARNTHENAVMTRPLADPKPGENWVLITSAFHMPRAVGCFRMAGWNVIPYPVDYLAEGRRAGLGFAPGGHLGSLRNALHEWAGLAVYYLSGRTDALFPAP